MDLIAAKLGANMAINSLTESGQIGTVDKEPIIITYDGTGEKIDFTDVFGGTFAKASDTIIEASQIASIKIYINGKVSEMPFEVRGDDPELFYGVYSGDTVLALVLSVDDEFPKGVYVLDKGSIGYVCEISTKPTETIKPIDPKYLPGLTLPVVDIGEVTLMAAVENIGNFVSVTPGESAALDKAAANASPIVLRIVFGGMVQDALVAPYSPDSYTCVPQTVEAEMRIDHSGGVWNVQVNAPSA